MEKLEKSSSIFKRQSDGFGQLVADAKKDLADQKLRQKITQVATVAATSVVAVPGGALFAFVGALGNSTAVALGGAATVLLVPVGTVVVAFYNPKTERFSSGIKSSPTTAVVDWTSLEREVLMVPPDLINENTRIQHECNKIDADLANAGAIRNIFNRADVARAEVQAQCFSAFSTWNGIAAHILEQRRSQLESIKKLANCSVSRNSHSEVVAPGADR